MDTDRNRTDVSPPPARERAPSPLYGDVPDAGALYGAPARGLALLDPWRLLRRWRTLALALALAMVVAGGHLWIAERIYRADSLLELSVRRPRIMTQQAAVIEDPAGALQAGEIFNTQLERFKGRTMLLAAMDRLDAERPGALFPPEPRRGRTVSPEHLRETRRRKFEKALTLTLIRRSRLIRVEFDHPDPELAAAACTAFMATVEAGAFEENRTTSDAAVTWLESQAESQRRELQAAEQTLVDFRRQYNIDALESRRKTVDDALLEFNRALVAIESSETTARVMASQLEELVMNPERAGEVPAEAPRAEEIRAALAQWRAAVVEREGLLTAYTEKHPQVQTRDNMIALYRDQAQQTLDRARATARANHRLFVEQADTLRRRKDEQIQLLAKLEIEIVEHRTRLAALERARDAADQAFRGILTRIQDARMAADENTATVKIVEIAEIPRRPIRPRPLRSLALALLLGLVGGIVAILVGDLFADRIVGPEDCEGCGLSVLAVVPHARDTDREAIATASIRRDASEIGEAYAGLGAVLDSPRHKDQSQVILVASSIPGEGKTVTSCNLAAAMALKGRRVLLVDFDLRRPRLAGIFPIPAGTPDLLAALTGPEPPFDTLPYPAPGCPNLDVIASRPAGRRSPAAAVGTATVERLLAWARTRYDHVVLDAPPLGLVSDILALAPRADITLVMVRPETSRRRLTLHTIHRLREAGIHDMGLVVNDLDVSKMIHSAYSPYYHYRHYYQAYAPAGNADGEAGGHASGNDPA